MDGNAAVSGRTCIRSGHSADGPAAMSPVAGKREGASPERREKSTDNRQVIPAKIDALDP